MDANFGYHYTAEGHHYMLSPDFTVGVRKLTITGAGVFDMHGKYLGYWDNFNMPLSLIAALRKWCWQHRTAEIAEKRKRTFSPPTEPNLRKPRF